MNFSRFLREGLLPTVICYFLYKNFYCRTITPNDIATISQYTQDKEKGLIPSRRVFHQQIKYGFFSREKLNLLIFALYGVGCVFTPKWPFSLHWFGAYVGGIYRFIMGYLYYQDPRVSLSALISSSFLLHKIPSLNMNAHMISGLLFNCNVFLFGAPAIFYCSDVISKKIRSYKPLLIENKRGTTTATFSGLLTTLFEVIRSKLTLENFIGLGAVSSVAILGIFCGKKQISQVGDSYLYAGEPVSTYK